jgi:DtxR family transcriptional regulator, Mn-dependent transcriptional regulator
MVNFSTSEENYIKAIFHLQSEDGNVTTNELADSLNTKPASVTDMMKKLKSRKLVHYQPYQGFRLSPDGRKVALGIIRRHRLWEYFLSEKLKFNWDEVHEVAEHLEHVSSKKLIDKLDEYLDFPKFDPHGDPIPDTNGKMESNKQLSLAEWPLNKPAIVSQVMNQSTELLELLQHKKISIGTRLEIKKRFDYDESVEIKIQKLSPITISGQLAKTIFVNHGTTT